MTVIYDALAVDYQAYRIPDQRISEKIDAQLENAGSILNVGAGTGSYEPTHCRVVALEPSQEMISKRSHGKAEAILGSAENIPFQDDEFDIAMGILTIHHWQNISRGLAEMKRVAKKKVVLLTWIDDSPRFWIQDYFPEMRDIDRQIFPTLAELESYLGKINVEVVEIPGDCTDGFMCAYWKRPAAYLDHRVRAAISTFSRMKNYEAGLAKLKIDLESGEWRSRYGKLLEASSLDLGYRLVVSERNA